MPRPNAASMLVLLASGAILLAASARLRPDTVVIDRAFLGPLLRLSPQRGPAWDAAGEVVWNNYDEMVYLARRGDPDAVRVVQHMFVIGGVPGGCSCSLGQLADTMFGQGDLPPGFLDLLRRLEPSDQVRILGVLDAEFKDAPDARYETWCEERTAYLAPAAAVTALYEATCGADAAGG